MVTSPFLTTLKEKREFRMIKPPQVLLVAAALLGCATQEQKNAAVDDWGDCVRSAVERVDDGKTDPMSVADGISAMCAAFYDKVRQSQIKVRQSSGTQKGQDANLKEGELRMIVSAILDHRAQARDQQKASR
jgi:hypothetical protein